MRPVLSLLSAACIAGLSMGAFASDALPPTAGAAAVEAAADAVAAPVFGNQLGSAAHELPALAADAPVAPQPVVAAPAAPLTPPPAVEAAAPAAPAAEAAAPATAAAEPQTEAPNGPLAALPPWNPEPLPQPETKPGSLSQASRDATSQAATSALADGVSTLGVLSAGGVEMNPIMPSSPIGIALMTAAKMGLANWAETLPDQQRAEILRSMNATFGGAAVNNLLVLITAGNPIALVGGLAAGIIFWQDTDEKLKAEAEAKAKHYRALAAAHHRETMALWNSVRVEAHEVNDSDIEARPLAAFDAPTEAAIEAVAADAGQPPVQPARTVQVAQIARDRAAPAAAAGVPAPALEDAPPLPAAPVLPAASKL